MRDLDWIKDLVEAEHKMEESGIVDVAAGYNPEDTLQNESVRFLNLIRELFVDFSNVYNKYRGAAVGGLKIYGIAKTQADFMLFRNGFKLFFILEKPGTVTIRSQFHGPEHVPGTIMSSTFLDQLGADDHIEARWGAFGEVIWTHQEMQVNPDLLVKFYITKFIKESTK